MPEIVIIGAGSQFGSRLSLDILAREELRGCEIALCDIDAKRLAQVRGFVQEAIDHHRLPNTVSASTERGALMRGADIVITSVSVGGFAYAGFPWSAEVNIPNRHGVSQCVADTIGIAACSASCARTWSADDTVELDLPMPVERVHAHPAVRADRGRVALMRGPLVYCAEGCDHDGDVDALVLPRDARFAEAREPAPGNAIALDAEAFAPSGDDGALYRREPPPRRRRALRLVPYHLWDDRAPGAMAVWLRDGG